MEEHCNDDAPEVSGHCNPVLIQLHNMECAIGSGNPAHKEIFFDSYSDISYSVVQTSPSTPNGNYTSLSNNRVAGTDQCF